MPNIWRTNHEQSDINETWPVMIYSIDICCFYKFKTKLASIRSIFLVFIRFIRASDLFFPFNERTEGIFEFRRTWSLEMQMRSITRDVCALNLSKKLVSGRLRFPGLQATVCNTMGIYHHYTRQASILTMRDVMFVWLDRFWCENGRGLVHMDLGILEISLNLLRDLDWFAWTEQCGFG